MTQPTPGRIMWFYESPNTCTIGFIPPRAGEPLAAVVASVNGDGTLVNLSVFDADGNLHPRQNVSVVQDSAPVPDAAYACWMPYQIGQAKKHAEPQTGDKKPDA